MIGLVDILPTLLSFAATPKGTEYPKADAFQGRDFFEYMMFNGPLPQNAVLFTYDDYEEYYKDEKDYPPHHIRAVQTAPKAISVNGDSKPYKYAVYYNYRQVDSEWEVDPASVQFELYDFDDQSEITNLLPVGGEAQSHARDVQRVLHELLTKLMYDADQKGPDGPVKPVSPKDPNTSVGPAVTPYGWSQIKVSGT